VQIHTESGAITIAETLIVLVIGIIGLTLWAQGRLNELEMDSARAAGRAIATYSRAASAWIAENPPATSNSFNITSLQDCDDENGARYLSCSFGAKTPIKLAFDSTGKRVNFGNLKIEVSVTNSGTTGTIDFGVFRSGNDRNNDNLPDSRPDLAAVALETASKETGAGVLNFFELNFVRESVDGVEFDENEVSFNQTEVDNLARLEAHVGASLKSVPFLRLDGTNEMTDGVRFENGMRLTMDGSGLSFDGPGDVEVATTTGTLVVSTKLETPTLESDSAEFDSLTVDNANGVNGNGFDRFDQVADIVRIDGTILTLTSRITANESTISNHATELMRLDSAVASSQTNIESNRVNIALNSGTITDNSERIQSLEDEDSSRYPLCTPSKQETITQLSAAGFGIYYDNQTLSGNCSTGANCTGVDRCGDTVRGTITMTNAWRNNPVSYVARNSSNLQCASYSMNFYSRCSCVVPNPGGCK